MGELTCLEICAGAGGQSLGLENAGFCHVACVEIDPDACETLRINRPDWNVIEGDIHHFSAKPWHGSVDLVAGGVPCPPFSIAGRQLGPDDERDLFPEALRVVEEVAPDVVMLENVRGLATERFATYRQGVVRRLEDLGYKPEWQVLNSSEFGVPQLRPRFILVALRPEIHQFFEWPQPQSTPTTVGAKLHDSMASRGWLGAEAWAIRADSIGPTLVGGSHKHGGPDLGPTRARQGWAKLGVDGRGLADEAPDASFPFDGLPRLTIQMAALIQGFPSHWRFAGRKTASYRQVGNAFPPPVAEAVGRQITKAIQAARGELEQRPLQLRLIS